MDRKTALGGIQYERLLMRAYHLKQPMLSVHADRRFFYLLYFIRNGADLRQTGYWKQFQDIKDYIRHAIQLLLQEELHPHEQQGLEHARTICEEAWNEDALIAAVQKALNATDRPDFSDSTSADHDAHTTQPFGTPGKTRSNMQPANR